MVILLTGSSNGIGKSILNRLINQGHKIITINRRVEEEHRENVTNLIYDLSNKQQVLNMIEEVNKYDVDVLINNAGGSDPKKISELYIDIIEQDLYLNFITPFLLIKTFYYKMINKKYSRIINISSISSKRGTPFLYTYSSAKAALDSLTQSVASTMKADGFTINSICPGGIDTKMSIDGRKKISSYLGFDSSDYQMSMINSMNLDSLISTEEVANLVEFLISPLANSISGQAINICGTLEVK